MKSEKKNVVEREDTQGQPKKYYNAPQLTVHGTVKELTGQQTRGARDTFASGTPVGIS